MFACGNQKEGSAKQAVEKFGIIRDAGGSIDGWQHYGRRRTFDRLFPEIAVSLHRSNHCRNTAIAVNFQLKHFADRIVRRAAELAQKFAVVPEIHPQPFRDSKYPLPVRHIGKHFLFETVSQKQGAFLIAGGAARALAA